MIKFSYAAPEENGISSSDITRFIRRLDKKGIPMHGLILMRNDKIVAEGYYKPYSKDTLHRAFSVVKSYVAIAIGLCEQEGLLHLDDTILSYFPEFEDKCVYPQIRKMTIKNMLMM